MNKDNIIKIGKVIIIVTMLIIVQYCVILREQNDKLNKKIAKYEFNKELCTIVEGFKSLDLNKKENLFLSENYNIVISEDKKYIIINTFSYYPEEKIKLSGNECFNLYKIFLTLFKDINFVKVDKDTNNE